MKGLARRLGGTYGVEGFAAANLLAAVAGEGVGGGANCIWTVANIWALKSSICFKRKPWRLLASDVEMPVEGAKAPNENGPDGVEGAGGATDGVTNGDEEAAETLVAAEDEATETDAVEEEDAAPVDEGLGYPANTAAGERRPRPTPVEDRVERPSRLAPPPPRENCLCLTLEDN